MKTIKLPTSVQERIKGLVNQQDVIKARIADIIATAIEAKEVAGEVTGYNVQTGEVTLKTASPNGVPEDVPVVATK